jgi:hypothetical protein
MMTIEYEPALMEEAVFLAARGDPRREAELHTAIDPLYLLDLGTRREQAFTTTYARFFTALRLHRSIEELLNELPLIATCVRQCIVRRADRRKVESAELFVKSDRTRSSPSEQTLILQICAESLLQPAAFQQVMRRELLHVADMLDPAFAYVPGDLLGGTPRDNLLRDRYRILWDTYVEGRVRKQEAPPPDVLATLERHVARAFACEQSEGARRIIDYVFRAPALTHRLLLDWTRHPDSLHTAARDDIGLTPC